MGNTETDIYSLVFKRSEYKYLLDNEKYLQVKEYIKQYTVPDIYGLSSVCNIYYDTEDNNLIRISMDKPIYKEKLRLRSYGVPKQDSIVFLEIKKKFDKIVYKRRIMLKLCEAEDYLNKGIVPPLNPENQQIFNEIDYFIKFHKVKPSIYISYDREAFFDKYDPNTRITFDSNIRGRTDNLTLTSAKGCQVLDFDYKYIMELKASEAFPIWLVKMLSELKIYKGTFSKYGKLYKKNFERNN